MAKVTLEKVYKIYPGEGKNQDKIAVDDANFEIQDREFMVLVGPSGCGKSTTLRMIAGLEDISKGTIRIGDRVINDVPPKDRDIAMVFQNYALYPHMTVYKNMAFGLQLRKYPREEIDKRVQVAADILGLKEPDNLLERKPKALSGGQRQRVALGRAIVRQPKAFLFDEPLSNLDAKMRVETRAEISKLHQRLNSTMIYVTHDQTEAMTMADRIVVMKNGIIQQIAEPLNLYREPANMFVAGFIGSPPMNFLHGSLATEEGKLFFKHSGKDAFRVEVSSEHEKKLESHKGKPIVFGIRPEDLKEAHTVEQPNPNCCFKATLDVKEPMGAETFLYLTVGENRAISRTQETAVQGNPGDAVEVCAEMRNARFFDPDSEQRIA